MEVRTARRWRWRWLLLVPVALICLALAGFLIWAETPLGPMPEAVAALRSDGKVVVERDEYVVFRPAEGRPRVGLIFYPGARIDPVSYAPPMRALAEQGYLAVIVPMPLNLAVFGSNRAADVIARNPQVRRWVVGGHSLGGAMAARFVASQPNAVLGLALWAAYPSAGDDLSKSALAVAGVSATNDGLTTTADVDRSKALLPKDTAFVTIDGGNHAQFGWYGPQRGDGTATISREDQQAQTVAATLNLLRRLE